MERNLRRLHPPPGFERSRLLPPPGFERSRLPPPPGFEHSPLPPISIEHSRLPPRSFEHSRLPPPGFERPQLPPPGFERFTLPPISFEHSQLPPPSFERSQLPPRSFERSRLPPPGFERSRLPPPGFERSRLPPPGFERSRLPFLNCCVLPNTNNPDANSHRSLPVPSIEATRGNNFYHQPQVPLSSPDDQMTNQDTSSPPEDNILNVSSAIQIDDVIVHEDVTNLDASSSRSWSDNEDDEEDDDDDEEDDESMTYEDLLDLQEQMGHVSTGLSEEEIVRHIKIKSYTSSTLNLDEEPERCVICQEEYEDNEEIGTLECGHCYHSECINKWLQRKNVCPLCKAAVLPARS